MISLDSLPAVRGTYRSNYELSKVTWFAVGGVADVLFKPADAEDLASFIAQKPNDLPITVIGVASNLLVRDGGLSGVVIRLGREFAHIDREDDLIVAGAAALTSNVARFAAEQGVAGLEFYIGIPGSVGGALAMNAGAYTSDTAHILVKAEAIDGTGKILTLAASDFGYVYRGNHLPKDLIFTKAYFSGTPENSQIVKERMNTIMSQRETTQPVRARTGGSTFKNPSGYSAWKLIDEAGCRGLRVGGAHVSEKHCNFLINDQDATADDIETLGEIVRQRVLEKTGISLEWEIKRIGRSK